MNILIADIRSAWQAHAYFEEAFADAVDVGWGILIDGLLMHRFPKRSCLHTRLVKDDAQRLHVGVGLAVGVGALAGMHHACRTTYRALYNGLISVFLSFDT